jgi:hypothetical protein
MKMIFTLRAQPLKMQFDLSTSYASIAFRNLRDDLEGEISDYVSREALIMKNGIEMAEAMGRALVPPITATYQMNQYTMGRSTEGARFGFDRLGPRSALAIRRAYQKHFDDEFRRRQQAKLRSENKRKRLLAAYRKEATQVVRRRIGDALPHITSSVVSYLPR